MPREFRTTVILCLLSLLLLPGLAAAIDRNVGPGQPYAAIQAAIDAANHGDRIVIHDGTYAETLVVDKTLEIVSRGYLDNGDNDGVIIDADDQSEYHAIDVVSSGVLIQGLSIYGAIGWSGAYNRAAIILREDNCVVHRNRLGWDEDHENSLGVRTEGADHVQISENTIWGWVQGIWMEGSRECTIIGNDIHRARSVPGSSGIYVYGDIYIPDPSWGATRNFIAQNEIDNCWNGVYMQTWVQGNTIFQNTISNCNIGVFGQDFMRFNMISSNVLHDNNRGIQINGTGQNTIVSNLIDNNVNGIWMGYLAPSDFGGRDNMISRNAITNSSYAGIRISANSSGNRMFLNAFAGNLNNVISEGTDWCTPTPMSYHRITNHNNSLGNYYDTYLGSDLDGDGIGDTDLPFIDGDPDTGPVENYPLVAPPESYLIQAWFVHGDEPLTMHRRDMTTVPGSLELPALGSVNWISDEPASTAIDFAAGAWTGQVSFLELPGYDAITVEIGSSSDGVSFVPSGAEVLIGADWVEPFATNAAAVSVPAGHYLALRITNTIDWPYTISTGGCHTYISSPGLNDPLWPIGWVNPVPEVQPADLWLGQNAPNPFNPSTEIRFSLPREDIVQLRIYDVRGRAVRTLIGDEGFPAGPHSVFWNGRDDTGSTMPSGVYFYSLRAGSHEEKRRMMLLK